MTSTIFKLVDNHAPDTLVMIPGWATDQRIFADIVLPYNYLLPLTFSPGTFVKALAAELRKRGLKRVSLLGYSLGGFLAADFSREYGDCVDRLVLAGIRRAYESREIDAIRTLLSKNKKAFLYKFYEQCCTDRAQWFYFKTHFFEEYCRIFDLEYLNAGLDYLAAARIDPRDLEAVQTVTFMHGELDRVAPLPEARALQSGVPQSRLVVVPGKGHLFFLPPGNWEGVSG